MGLFLGINGWSEHVVSLLKQTPDKRLLLMNGYDVRQILAEPLDLRSVVQAKLQALNLHAEPFLSVRDLPDVAICP
jgi:hypothetical protein